MLRKLQRFAKLQERPYGDGSSPGCLMRGTAGGHYRIAHEDLHTLIKSKIMDYSCRDDGNKQKILIIDDDSPVRKMLGQALSRKGHDVAYAFEVCQQLKKNNDTSAIKIIAISGAETNGNEEQILSCDANLFFVKPVDLKVLINEIHHLIGTE